MNVPAPPPTTPNRKPDPQSAKITPPSQNSSSKLKADGSSPKRPEEFRDLFQDISETKTVDLPTFSETNLNRILDTNDPLPLSMDEKAVSTKLEVYLKAAEKRSHEKSLYEPLTELLNEICKSSGSDDAARVFYTQAERALLGYHLDRKPDIGYISRKFLDLDDDGDLETFLRENWVEGMHWLLMLLFVEVKHENGNALGYKASKQAKSEVDEKGIDPGSSKKASSEDSPGKDSPLLPSQNAVASSSAPPPEPDPKDGRSALFQETRRQVASYSKAMFSAGVIRSHVIALVVDDATFRFVYYTRSIIIETQAANLNDELQRRWFIILIHHLHSLSEQKLGLVPNMVPPPPLDFKLKRAKKIIKRTREGAEESEPLSKKSKADTKGGEKEQPESQLPPVLSKSPLSYNIQTPTSVPTSVEEPQTSQSPTHHSSPHPSSSEPYAFFPNDQGPTSAHTSVEAAEATDPPPVYAFPSLKGSTYTIVTDGFERVLRVTDDIFRSNGLIGRGTCVMAVECDTEKSVDNAQRVITPEQSWKGKPLVLKLSFPPSTRTRESTLIDTARKYADEHGAHWALKHLPVVLASADNLDWGDHGSGENTLQNKLKKLFGDAYEMRTFRATVLKKLEPLSSLKNAREFAQVFYDILQILQWLFLHPKILHRDVSMANIMYLRDSDNVYGVLIDFDLASFLMDMDKSPTSKFRTGTKPYMSFDLLTSRYAKTDKGHLYRYDLESLFYIVLILSCHYTGPNTLTSRLHFSQWFDRADQDVANEKLLFLQDTEEPPVQEFFSGFSDWIRSIRLMLGMGYNNRLFLGMSEKIRPSLPSEIATYDFETLGGNITYMKMTEVMSTFEGEGLLLRSGSSEE